MRTGPSLPFGLTTHRLLPQLTARLLRAVLARVQVQPLRLEHRLLLANRPHLAVEELLQRLHEAQARRPDEVALALAQLLLGLAHFDQRAPVVAVLAELASGLERIGNDNGLGPVSEFVAD